LGAACVALGAPWPIRVIALGFVAAHALARRPPPAPRVILGADGRVSLPDRGLADLELGPRTRYTTLWIRLDLRAPGRTLYILLVADQLDESSWRAALSELRRMRPRAAPAPGGSGDSRSDLR